MGGNLVKLMGYFVFGGFLIWVWEVKIVGVIKLECFVVVLVVLGKILYVIDIVVMIYVYDIVIGVQCWFMNFGVEGKK